MDEKKFKKDLKKLGAKEMLLKYKNELNKKQWDKLHSIINKELKEQKEITLIHFGLAFIIILVFAFTYKGNYAEQVQKCSDMKGHMCSAYEIQEIFD